MDDDRFTSAWDEISSSPLLIFISSDHVSNRKRNGRVLILTTDGKDEDRIVKTSASANVISKALKDPLSNLRCRDTLSHALPCTYTPLIPKLTALLALLLMRYVIVTMLLQAVQAASGRKAPHPSSAAISCGENGSETDRDKRVPHEPGWKQFRHEAAEVEGRAEGTCCGAYEDKEQDARLRPKRS